MARTIKKFTGITIGRKCSNCGKDIWLHVMEDDEGKFVIESCDCKLDDIIARTTKTELTNAYALPEYLQYLTDQIAALTSAKQELEKLL